MFLNLMVAQLRYQDPLNPADSGEFLAQSAQFTSLEKMQDMVDQSTALLGSPGGVRRRGHGRGRTSAIWPRTAPLPPARSARCTFDVSGPMLVIGGTERQPRPDHLHHRPLGRHASPTTPRPPARRPTRRHRRPDPLLPGELRCFVHSSPASAACASTRPCSTSPATTSPTPTPSASRPARTLFQDTLSQMLTVAPGTQRCRHARRDQPDPGRSGRPVAATSTNFTQGSNQTTGQITDLMIQGDGMFVIKQGWRRETSTPEPAPSASTRHANLVSPGGGFVQGYLFDDAGDPVDGDLHNLSLDSDTGQPARLRS